MIREPLSNVGSTSTEVNSCTINERSAGIDGNQTNGQ